MAKTAIHINTEIFSYLTRDVEVSVKQFPSDEIRINPFTREVANVDDLMPGEAWTYYLMRSRGREEAAKEYRGEHDEVDPSWYESMDVFVALGRGVSLPGGFNEKLLQKMRREELI